MVKILWKKNINTKKYGSIYKQIPSGKLGDISVFSFDPMKNLPTFGTGGMVLTDNDKIYKRIISLRRHGLGSNYEYGYNSLMPEDHCNQLLFWETPLSLLFWK